MMQSFIDYCSGFRRAHHMPAARVESPIPESVRRARARMKPLFICGNFACVRETENKDEWKSVKIHEKKYYFCSEECYCEWLDSPGYLGSWSPPNVTTPVVSAPPDLNI